jgi:broad specificity phosphatase PhoE
MTSRDRPEVVLVRHGETQWTLSGQHTSRTDIALTHVGRRQARALGRLLAGRPFAAVLTSPRRRAADTAALAGYRDAARLREELAEWDYGDYEGGTTADIQQQIPGWTVWSHPSPGGETAGHVGARADQAIAAARAVDGDVVFGRGHMLRVLAAR